MTPDPSRLSDGERRVLSLLAEGHTAKSIAGATGLSVNAVNERLREARRKTGVGSSRELARLLRLQENRDEEIGVPDEVADDGGDRDKAAPRRSGSGTRKGPIVMGLFIIAGVAGIALIAGEPQSSPGRKVPVEPRLAGLLSDDQPDSRNLYQRIRSEKRDEAWAKGTEARLRALYSPLKRISDLRVRCTTTLCEVVGNFPAGPDDGTLLEAQRRGLQPDAVPGLKHVMFSVGAEPGKSGAVMLAYFEQAAR